jgi:hypothetical protein
MRAPIVGRVARCTFIGTSLASAMMLFAGIIRSARMEPGVVA